MTKDTPIKRGWALGLAKMLALFSIATVAMTSGTWAEEQFPTRPIRLIIGFAAGGPSDIIARDVAAKLGEILGKPVFVENRTGASGNIATEYVARSEPDGYTLLVGAPAMPVNESLFKNFPYKVGKDFTPVALFAGTSLVLVVHPSLDVRSVSDLIALAKSKPGELFYATAGKGTATHLAGELFDMDTGVKITPIHYKGGGETIKDLLSGEVKVMFSSISPVLDFVKQGKLLGLATTGKKRDPVLPDLPTIAEAGLPGYEVWLWTGLMAPAATPHAVIDRLAAATEQALHSDDLKKQLAALGNQPMFGTPTEFAAYYRAEADKYAKLIPIIGTIGD